MRTSRIGSAVFAGGFALAALMTLVAILFAISGFGDAGPASPPLFALVFVSLAIVLGLGAVLARRLVQVIAARQTPAAGSRLQLRFVALFGAAAVIPAVFVAIFLGAMMGRNVEDWFRTRVQTTISSAADVGKNYVDSARQTINDQMRLMASDLNYAEGALAADPSRYKDFLLKQAGVRGFSSAYVLRSDGEVLAQANVDPDPDYKPPRRADFGEAVTKPTLTVFEDSGVIRGLLKLDAYPDAYLYVARSESLLRQLRVFSRSVEEYREALGSRAELKWLFALAYLNVTLLVLLGAVWLGLANAARVSEPIGRLADAAGRVAAGDLTVRVAVGLERDEVDELGSAFNRMTSQLETQRADLVKARHEAEERSVFIQTVLSNVSAGVIGIDQAGRVTAANSSAARLLGLDARSLDGRRLAEIAPEFVDLARAAQESPDQGSRRIDISRGGATLHLSIRASRVESGEGVVLTFDDQTKLFAAQRTEAWKDVARRIAHEIKNPLTPIQLSAERLRKKYASEIQSDPETFERCTATILRQVADIGRMVDEFSSFARMPAPKIEQVDLAELAREAVFSQRLAHADIRFDVEGAQTPLIVACDGRLIAQALTNILKNAAEAIGARRAADGEPKEGHVLLKLEPLGREALISIMDNGIGLPGQDRARLVEPYVTTRAKGTGLGLAIVKRVVEDHGGSLALADTPMPGPGAMICISLPLAAQSPAGAAPAQAES